MKTDFVCGNPVKCSKENNKACLANSSSSIGAHIFSVLVRASAYLIDAREDGHESTKHCCTDAGNVDKWALKEAERNHIVISV